MKQLLTSLLLFAVALSAAAQGQHIKFMGLPLDGTISQFEQKLVAKGLRPDREYNSECDLNERGYEGKFNGREANIYIEFDYATKIMYKAEVYIENDSRSESTSMYELYVDKLNNKYSDWDAEDDEYGSYPQRYWRSDVGEINLYQDDSYNVVIVYEDKANLRKHRISQMKDL